MVKTLEAVEHWRRRYEGWHLVTTLGRWQRKNMRTVETRMMARLQSRDCWVARRSLSLSGVMVGNILEDTTSVQVLSS